MEDKDLSKLLKEAGESAKQLGEIIGNALKEYSNFAKENNKKDRFDIIEGLMHKIDCDTARYGEDGYLILINPDVLENINLPTYNKNLQESEGLHGVFMGYDCIVTDSVKEAEVYRKVK